MECLNPEATAEECNLSEMIGYLAAILAGVFLCSCVVSGCCFYCRWKIRRPDVGAITLKSSKTGVKQEVRFHVFQRKGTEDTSQVAQSPSLQTQETAQSRDQKKTVVSWQLDTQNASSRSLVSTGKVLLTTAGQGKTPADLNLQRTGSLPEAAPSNANSPNKKPKKKKEKVIEEISPSRWRKRLAGLADIIRLGDGLHKEAYEVNTSVEYFSPSNNVWTAAVIVSRGEFDEDGLPSYTLRVGRQRRHKVPIKFIRPHLRGGEPVRFFSGQETSWIDAIIATDPVSATLGYEVDIRDFSGKPSLAVAARLRRRFLVDQAVQVYNGQFCGWVDAVVVEDALENADEIPGQHMNDPEKVDMLSPDAMSPEVMVKCYLREGDELPEPEVVEFASGCVRYAGHLVFNPV